MTAREHFDWAMARAVEYLDDDRPTDALMSLISDLNKHTGTAGILHQDLIGLALGELQLGGTRGLRRFIEGIPAPPNVDENEVAGGDG